MDHGRGDGYSLLSKLGLGALTGNSAIALYRSWGDPASTTFVLVADAALLLLLHFLRRREHARHEDGGTAKAAVWALTTLLTVMFAHRRRRLGDGGGDGRRWVLGIYAPLSAGGSGEIIMYPARPASSLKMEGVVS
jgi:hypothetical protein